MASSYTSNLGVEKPGSGDQSGTWGVTTNRNFDIFDRAISGVGAITLSGTAHTLTTTDGALSDGGFRVLVLGGSPSGTNTITITPNDQDKLYLVKNGSGQTASFSQGSGANASVANGEIAWIFADGAGSGAAVEKAVFTSTVANISDLTATASELNIMDGVTASTSELNIMDGVTASTSELNIMDGVTATASELNIMDGVTATTSELNIMDGVTATTAELNYNDTGAAVGTVVASKTVTVDANKDVSSFRNVTMTGEVAAATGLLSAAAPLLQIKDTDTNRFVDVLYGTSVTTFRNTMASGEDIDTVEPTFVFSFKDDGETRTAMTIGDDGTTTVTTGDAATIIHRVGTNVAGVKTASGDDICVGTADFAQAIRIKNADGHVGIGNAAPSSQLHVNADDDDEVLQVHADSSTYTSNVIYVQTTKAANNDFRYFKANENNGSATSIQILGNGDVQNANNSYGAISDERIKQDITEANSQWNDILSIKGINYKEKYRVSEDGDNAPVLIGLSAQDLEDAGMHGLVETTQPDKYQREVLGITENVKAVKYSVLYMKAVLALQEAMTRIETLETKVAALESGK